MSNQFVQSAAGSAVGEVLASIGGAQPAFFLFFYGAEVDASGVDKALKDTGVPYIACMDSGRLVTGRYLLDEKSVVGISFQRSVIEAIRVETVSLDPGRPREEIRQDSSAKLRSAAATLGIDLKKPDMEREFAINIAYGLASANPFLEGQSEAGLMLQTMGGSSGGKTDFKVSNVVSSAGGGSVAAFALIRLSKQFKFHTDRVSSFEKVGGVTLEVTRLNGPRDIVELNGQGAAVAYAGALGLSEKGLTPDSFASYTLGIEPGDGERLITSIMTTDGKGGLLTYNDVIQGTRFNLYKALSQKGERAAAFGELKKKDLIAYLSFDCILCYLARNSLSEVPAIAALYEDAFPGVPKIGFGTFSENICGANVNQTETYLAILKA